ncbi:MAG: hypothetical protein EAX81_06000 [Candidatus Thorarchaeota archaeon]|nr:hypothetical protein [Candidatus Thorarchaeota archaeon]
MMQLDWIISYIQAAIEFVLIFTVIFMIVSIMSLGYALNYVGGKNTGFFSSSISAILMVILVVFIPCLGCIIALYLLKLRHNISWGKAIIAVLLAGIIAIAAYIVVAFLFLGGLTAISALIPFLP